MVNDTEPRPAERKAKKAKLEINYYQLIIKYSGWLKASPRILVPSSPTNPHAQHGHNEG